VPRRPNGKALATREWDRRQARKTSMIPASPPWPTNLPRAAKKAMRGRSSPGPARLFPSSPRPFVHGSSYCAYEPNEPRFPPRKGCRQSETERRTRGAMVSPFTGTRGGSCSGRRRRKRSRLFFFFCRSRPIDSLSLVHTSDRCCIALAPRR
jgi:hypothetical protein